MSIKKLKKKNFLKKEIRVNYKLKQNLKRKVKKIFLNKKKLNFNFFLLRQYFLKIFYKKFLSGILKF